MPDFIKKILGMLMAQQPLQQAAQQGQLTPPPANPNIEQNNTQMQQIIQEYMKQQKLKMIQDQMMKASQGARNVSMGPQVQSFEGAEKA